MADTNASEFVRLEIRAPLTSLVVFCVVTAAASASFFSPFSASPSLSPSPATPFDISAVAFSSSSKSLTINAKG